MNIQGQFPLGSSCLISLPSKKQASSPAPQHENINSLVFRFLYGPTLKSLTWLVEKPYPDYMDLCQKNDVSAFYILSRFEIAFLPRSKDLLISLYTWKWKWTHSFESDSLWPHVAYQAPPFMGFSRQEYWSGLLHCRQTLYPLSHQGSIIYIFSLIIIIYYWV